MSQQPPFDPRPYLGPRYWLAWFGLGLLWLLVRLPYRLQLALGAAFGMLLYGLMPERRRIGRINLAIAFPELDRTQRARLLRRHFRALGIGILEMGMAWWRRPKWLLGMSRIEGLEHLQAARRDGRGVILLFPHYTCLELAAVTIACATPVHGLYGEPRNLLFRAVLDHYRRRRVVETIPARDVRRCVRVLKAGEILIYLPDQATHLARGGILVEYFGRPTLTTPGTSRLARVSGARVIPLSARRLAGAGGYQLRCLPPLEDFPGEDLVEDTRRINALFESMIRQAPEQYLWVHKRFKRRTEGEADPYAS